MSNLAVVINDTHYFMQASSDNEKKCYSIENILVLVDPSGSLKVTIGGLTYILNVDKQTVSLNLSEFQLHLANVVEEVGTPGWFGFTKLEIVERRTSPLDEKLISRKVKYQCNAYTIAREEHNCFYPCPREEWGLDEPRY